MANERVSGNLGQNEQIIKFSGSQPLQCSVLASITNELRTHGKCIFIGGVTLI